MINKRLLTTFFLMLAIVFLPYWLYVPALVLAMAFFPLYWEAILLSFLINVLYTPGWHTLWSIIFSPGFFSLVGLLLLLPLRRRLRAYV